MKNYIYDDTVIDGKGPWATFRANIHDESFLHISNDWARHKQFIDNYIPEDKRRLVVQGGGHHGLYAELLSSYFSTVYTFEPHPDNFYCLTLNCKSDNIIKIQSALGATDGSLTLEETVTTGQHRILHDGDMYRMPTTGRFYRTHSTSIDSLNLEQCDFIFLDVENYEHEVLIGAMKTIKKFKPAICLEVSCFEKNNDFNILLLNMNGYEVVDRSSSDIYFVNGLEARRSGN